MFLQPDIIKSCSNCKQKKVKCPGELPVCNKCKKSNLQCDVIDNVGYSYQTVQTLVNIIKKLETEIVESENNYKSLNLNDEIHSINSNNSNNRITNSNNDNADADTKLKKDITIDEISTEVGSLTVSNNNMFQGKYIGAATGSNFAKLFLKQMHLQKINEIDYNSTNDFENFDSAVSTSYAPLPPYRIAKYAVYKYINTIHIYYPLLLIHDLKNSLEVFYKNPRQISYYEKYILFMVISLGLDRSEKDTEFFQYKSQFKPIEYFNTAYRYLEEILSNRSEKSLQSILLLIIWLLHTSVLKDDNGDLWHLGRFSMSLAMELGVHRFNPEWNFGEVRNELRNRIFWCTYILERAIAMKFGRGLSLRKQAIDTPLPKLLKDDYINSDNFNNDHLLNSYNQVQFKPSLLMINLCEIYGDMLESVYISRTKGSKPTLGIEEIINIKTNLQNLLSQWMMQINNEIPSSLDCYYELKVRYCITSIILNRPSPSFPIPDTESLLRCKKNCEECVDCFCHLLDNNWKINPTCLHDLVNIGLTMIYCCWKIESNSTILKEFSIKILNIMNEVIQFFPSFTKFKNLFIIVSSTIIESIETNNNNNNNNHGQANPNSHQGFIFQQNPDNVQQQQMPENMRYPANGTQNNNTNLNTGMEFNDWFTQELFQDAFRQYYYQGNDSIADDLDQLYDFQKFSRP